MDDHEVLTDFAGALLLHGLLIFAIGFGLAPGNWLALVTATCSLAAGVRVLGGARAAAGPANHCPARREGGSGPAART